MQCPHCRIEFDSTHSMVVTNIRTDDNLFAEVRSWRCPSCRHLTLDFARHNENEPPSNQLLVQRRRIYPAGVSRALPPQEVSEFDPFVHADYLEACQIHELSPKAAAALGRRCIQHLIRYQLGIRKRTLFEEIETVKDQQLLPRSILRQIDAVRHIGNAGAHPMEDLAGRILPVTVDEATWTLDVVLEMFDQLFVQPVREHRRTTEQIAKTGRDLPLPDLPRRIETEPPEDSPESELTAE